MSTAFQKGDSNRSRTVYKQILRAELPAHDMDSRKKLCGNIAVGDCRMLAINHRVPLPSYNSIRRAGFDQAKVPRDEWSIPIACKRIKKRLPKQPACRGPCKTCDEVAERALGAALESIPAFELADDNELDLLLELADVLPPDFEDVAAHNTIEHPARQLHLGSSRELALPVPAEPLLTERARASVATAVDAAAGFSTTTNCDKSAPAAVPHDAALPVASSPTSCITGALSSEMAPPSVHLPASSGVSAEVSEQGALGFKMSDSNRVRGVYEGILQKAVPADEWKAQKVSKHVSVGRCRMLAINRGIALPPDEALRRAGFVEDRVPRDKWSVPTDCKRHEKKRKQNGSCRGRCETCSILNAKTLHGLAEVLQGGAQAVSGA